MPASASPSTSRRARRAALLLAGAGALAVSLVLLPALRVDPVASSS